MSFNLHNYYPFPKNWSKRLMRSLLVGATITWFLYFFQPFGISSLEEGNKHLLLAGFGGISFIAFAFYFLLLPAIFPTHINDWDWSIGKQVLLISLTLLSIAFFGYFYKQWYLNLPHSFAAFTLFSARAFSVAAFPLTFLFLIDKINLLQGN